MIIGLCRRSSSELAITYAVIDGPKFANANVHGVLQLRLVKRDELATELFPGGPRRHRSQE